MAEPQFLSDEPLSLDVKRDIYFGHQDIANSLYEIIAKDCPKPFTVGLFGQWGTGKTTIINILNNKLHDVEIPTVLFDVWKYEDDALRRTFLREIVEQLKKKNCLASNFSLTERMDASIKKEIRASFSLTLYKALTFGAILLAILGLGALLSNLFPSAFALKDFFNFLLGSTFAAGFLLWIIKEIFTTETVLATLERFKDPHEFEGEFHRTIEALNEKAIVIEIDNLDRCRHDKAVELLSTVKTFLAKDSDSHLQKVIFLIACDDAAIKKHLEKVFGVTKNAAFSPDEFLRKFFNVFIRIPTFIDTELQKYTEDLLKETHVADFTSKDLAYVIASSFRENPRQIKQFINTLLAHFLLAKEREESEMPLMPVGTVSKNAAYLAKILIIQQNFPLVYRELERRYLTDEEAQNIENKEDPEQITKFKAFLRATKTITAPDIRPFIHLKQSEIERSIKGAKEIEAGLVDNHIEFVSDKFKAIKLDSQQLDSLKRFLPNLLSNNKGRKQPLLNIISCSLECLKQNAIKLEKDFYDRIADLLLEEGELKDEIATIEPVLIFEEIIANCDGKYKPALINRCIHVFSVVGQSNQRLPLDYAAKLLERFIANKEKVKTQANKIRETMSELYSTQTKLLSLFKDKEEEQEMFLGSESPEKLLASFTENDIDNEKSFQEKVAVLIDLKPISRALTVETFLRMFISLMSAESAKEFRAGKENFFKCTTSLLRAYQNLIPSVDKTTLGKFSDGIINGFPRISDWNQRKIIMPLQLLQSNIDASRTSQLDSQAQAFFNNASLESIQYVFSNLSEEEIKKTVEKFAAVFQTKGSQNQVSFDYLYEKAPSNIKNAWLCNLITSPHYERALNKLRELKYAVEDSKEVVKSLLHQVQAVGESQRLGFYSAINQMECAKNPELQKELISHIKSLLRGNSSQSQTVGISALQEASKYFPASVKREIACDTIEWLRTLNTSSVLQPPAIKSVMISWDSLEGQKPVQQEYVDFIFDKLIKRATVNPIDSIRLGYEILISISPSYEEYPIYFDDVLVRIENEKSNSEIRMELVSGLSKLKQQQKNIENEHVFWSKVDKLIVSSAAKN